ncbi:AsmA-like C-terminal region-containing protein [Prosthecobacter fusiformis]|uniref:AsmA-like C-terminal region-containing protein n=1 Tax=Prosthecobacter fusiformis TaxID=48464 RepID=UPI001414E5FC|nr:AsmA-like C-terminal region-containing protein [Prosthecobacter fusiformis]
MSKARKEVDERLEKRGLVLNAKSESWSLWGGITLKEATLSRLTGDQPPLFEISELHVDVPWREVWAAKSAITHWRAEDAILVLNDDQGSVTMEGLTTDFAVRQGTIEVAGLGMRQGPLVIELKGEILTATGGGGSSEFNPNWNGLRSVLKTLSFKPGSDPFRITGLFNVDLRTPPAIWSVDLRGEGNQVNWRGLPMQNALVEGQASQGGLRLTANLKLLKGSGLVELSREGWKDTPLIMTGTLTDSAGRSDEFIGRYEGKARTVTIEQISGSADLVELAQGFPALAEKIPAGVTVKTFPEILAKDFVLQTGVQPPVWSLASAQFKTPASIVVIVRDQPVNVENITGGLSYQKDQWHFHSLKGKLLEGTFALDADYDGQKLTDAKISLKSLRLARLSPWLGNVGSGLENSDLTMDYAGSICNDPVDSTGGGTLVLSDAPVVHIPLLEQTYALFPKLLPDRGRASAGSFQVTFTMNNGVATIDPFKARSEALTVTATGTVDLVKRRVQGHARANLRGIVGRITLPLSHVLTDMEISGPLDDIRVSPEGPIGGAKKLIGGSAEAAKDSVKLSGDVLKEGLSLPFQALGMFRDK